MKQNTKIRIMIVTAWLLFIVLISIAYAIITWAILLPEVHKSWPTGECVKVIGKYSCDNLPENYRTIWMGE